MTPCNLKTDNLFKKMNMFQSEVRQLILKIKTSEDWQKKCKEKLVNLLRTEQIHPISNVWMKSEFTSVTKQLLVQLKDTDELNKSSRSILRKILTSEQNLRMNRRALPLENQIQTLGFQSSHHDEKQINHISFGNRIRIQAREVQTQDFENSVQETPLAEPVEFIRQDISIDLIQINTTRNPEKWTLVKFTNHLILTIFRKFIGKKRTNKMGIG